MTSGDASLSKARSSAARFWEAHDRRRVLHFNVTSNPTAEWTAQQIVEAFPWELSVKYLLRDRDKIYGEAFQKRVRNMGLDEVRTAPRRGRLW
jgi:hypothetical protein